MIEFGLGRMTRGFQRLGEGFWDSQVGVPGRPSKLHGLQAPLASISVCFPPWVSHKGRN